MKSTMKDYTWATILLWIGLMLLGLVILATQSRAADSPTPHAAVVLHPTVGNRVSGQLTFTKNMEGVRGIH